jgi:hypothetical protein
VIIGHFNVECVSIFPSKAKSPLLIDTDTVLALPVARKSLQSIAGRDMKIVERLRAMNQDELAVSKTLDFMGQSPGELAMPDLVSLFVLEGLDHQ